MQTNYPNKSGKFKKKQMWKDGKAKFNREILYKAIIDQMISQTK